jgi:hypothetical protein
MNDFIIISNMMSIDSCPKNKVNISVQRTQEQIYSVINYDKQYVNSDDLYLGLYRSIIFSFPNKKLLSYSPSKSISYSYFKKLFPIMNEDIIITEYINGIMIHLFYDERIKKWEIATKEFVGGNQLYTYDKQERTIVEIFIECMGGCSYDKLNSLPFLEYFSTTYNYVFILRTGYFENEMVNNYKCFLIGVYSVNNELPHSLKYVPENVYINWDSIECIKGLVNFPKKYFFVNYSDVEEFIKYIHVPCKFVLTNQKNTLHTHIVNNEYNVHKSVIMENPYNYYLYFCLKRVYKYPQQLYINFPQLKPMLFKIYNIYRLLISNFYNAYRNYFVFKTSYSLSKYYKKHLWKIHKKYYIPYIRMKTKPVITRYTIEEYFETLSPNELMYLIRIHDNF